MNAVVSELKPAAHRVVSQDQWLAMRKAFLEREKQLTRMRDEVARERRELPWVRIEKDYVFETPEGKRSLADLFEGRSQLATWIFGICQRVASDYRRSALIRCEVVTDASELDLRSDDDHNVVEQSETRRRAEVAEAILSRLPEPQRIVFVLFELEEMSGDDIAALLEVPVGTVRSRLRLARETFRREVRRLAAAGSVPRKEAV